MAEQQSELSKRLAEIRKKQRQELIALLKEYPYDPTNPDPAYATAFAMLVKMALSSGEVEEELRKVLKMSSEEFERFTDESFESIKRSFDNAKRGVFEGLQRFVENIDRKPTA